jgi:alkylhydroperoxidase family enzyme
MSRIPPKANVPVPLDEHAGSMHMSRLFHVMAHRPDIMQHAVELLEATMRGGTVEPKLKELLAIRVSQVNHCHY